MKFPLLFLTFAVCFQVSAQKKNEAFRLHIKKTNLPVTIDGVGDDKVWETTDVAKNFFMVLPMDDGQANEQSEIRMTYDDTHLYLLATFF